MLTSTYPTKHWHKLVDGRIQCDICPRQCQLKPGQDGFCAVRGYAESGLVLRTFGRSIGLCIDPIEKKPLHHFLPGSSVLSFGTAGCNLSCRFCQNWNMSKARAIHASTTISTPEAIAHAAKKFNCRSIAYTYNDPVVFLEYAIATAQACQSLGIHNVAVTAGYINPEARADLFAAMQAANVDLKGFSETFYRKLCGGHLAPVLNTLMYLKHETRVWLEITTLLIPNENDSEAELNAMTNWIREQLGADVPLHFSAFHPSYRMHDTNATPIATLTRARKIAMSNGLRYVYTGNVHDPIGSSTWCHQCGALLIERDWYKLGNWGLDTAGNCQRCGTQLPGVFNAKPDAWGQRRLPVNIQAV